MNLDQKKYQELFIEEAKEQLQSLNQALLAIESSGEDPELINEAFRLVHTVKGAAMILGINTIGDIAHITEDIFDKIRNKTILINQEMIDILFESIDYMTKMVNELSSNGEITSDCSDFLNRLREIISSDDKRPQHTKNPLTQEIELNDEQKTALMDAKDEGLNVFFISIVLNKSCKLKQPNIV